MKVIIVMLIAGVCFYAYSEDKVDSPSYPYIIEHANKMDQFEEINRKTFYFNSVIKEYIQRPMAIGWASVMPEHGIKCVNRFFNNLDYLKRLINSLLQADLS